MMFPAIIKHSEHSKY